MLAGEFWELKSTSLKAATFGHPCLKRKISAVPQGRFSERLDSISRGERSRTFGLKPGSKPFRNGELENQDVVLALAPARAPTRPPRSGRFAAHLPPPPPAARREASRGRGGVGGVLAGPAAALLCKSPTASRTDELDEEASTGRSGDMSLDLEDSEDDFQPSTSSLYKSTNSMIQEEKALLEEPGANQYGYCKPKDHWNATYIIFFLLGTNSLLPLNFIITAKHYWMYKLQNCSEDISPEEQGSSDIRNFFESYISVASTVPSVLSLIGNFLLVNKVSVNVRILSSLAVMLVIFLVITVLVKVDTSAWTVGFFIITIVCVAVISSAATIFISSVFGLSGSFPMRNSQALISGQAMGGTLSALASVVNLAAASEVTNSALAYFLIGDIFIVLCIVLYLILPKLEFARYYTATLSPNALPSSYLEEEDMAADNPSQLLPNRNYTNKIPPLWLILKKIGMLGFYVFYVYFISITIFPAISSSIESVNKFSGSPWTDKYFTPVTSFLLYNFADWCGRQITAWVQVPGPRSKWLPAMILLRTCFIPLFMLCNYQPRTHIAKVTFARDVYPVVFIVSLGLSNGYLSTLSIIYGPKITPKELSEAAGVLMMIFMQVGLALGSGFSVLVVHLI